MCLLRAYSDGVEALTGFVLVFGFAARLWMLIGWDKISRPLRAWMWRQEAVSDGITGHGDAVDVPAPRRPLRARIWPKIAFWLECPFCSGLVVALAATSLYAAAGDHVAVRVVYAAFAVNLVWAGVWNGADEIGKWRQIYSRAVQRGR
jgi:hypothetical protein